jgi:predicted ArsR family transcriptional regulator
VLQRTVADLRALAHPLRLRMMELFAESPKTTKQVAGILGQPPTRLYHHVAALERSGLLVLKEKRKNRGAVEKWYVGVSQQIQAAGSKAQGRSARRAVAATVLEQAKQEVMSLPAGAKEPALLARLVVAAPRAKIPAIRKRLFDTVQALRRAFQSGAGTSTKTEDCERWAVTVAFAPVRAPARR